MTWLAAHPYLGFLTGAAGLTAAAVIWAAMSLTRRLRTWRHAGDVGEHAAQAIAITTPVTITLRCQACTPGIDGLCTCTSGCGSDLCQGYDHTTLGVLDRSQVRWLRSVSRKPEKR